MLTKIIIAVMTVSVLADDLRFPRPGCGADPADPEAERPDHADFQKIWFSLAEGQELIAASAQCWRQQHQPCTRP